MLGANITNMALIGTGLGGLLRVFLVQRGLNSPLATALAAAVAVDLAAGADSLRQRLSRRLRMGDGAFQSSTGARRFRRCPIG